eukprot:CAMPEP_0183748208 /NCGR_PEP_ID=MMETSP0737-20130205/67654_1 /TAXON_ID=385413 /ORGANISM="Thalassiosira miniscula, Strain CCMP1093" /LENGTH=199 /DNA_ID=CAMNT_0025983927 /DNA_START=226 /DNA_END=821 /DNA_ORIENTATION=+
MLQDELILKEYRRKGAGWTASEAYPFLYNTDRLFANDVLINEFYGRGLREYLAFDEETKLSSGCCSMLPAPDEQRRKGAGWTASEAYPFLYNTDRLFANDVLINEFYGRGLREYLAFDEETKLSSGCCSMLPASDEHVFHYRSFITDLPKKHMAWGGAELVPSKSAELLTRSGGLPPGTKIALVTGRATPHRIQSYKEA